jgi:hypothetical protein
VSHLKPFLFALALTLALFGCEQSNANKANQPDVVNARQETGTSNSLIEQAFSQKQSNIQVSGSGLVVKLLADDNKGARHQKFLVKINAEQTLLFAHNIDLAPRVPLQTGDKISFRGEYVYNPKGGIIHWTHHAPKADHEAGWIMLNENKYQ